MRNSISRILCAILIITTLLMLFPASAFARDELKNTDPERFYIVLDVRNQIVFVYEKDEDGEYTRLVRCFICSSGRTEPENPEDPEDKGTPTPTGIWRMGARERFGKFAAFGGEYARYWTQIVGGNYFHSIMFGKREVTALKSGAFGRLGSAVSHGCVRLYIEDAKWLYYYACPGTRVEVTTNTERQGDLKKVLRTALSFKEYDALQENIYDEPELPNLNAWIVYDNAPMRTGNGSNDRVIMKIPEGEQVEILQEGDPWVKVKYNDREGYVLLAYVTYEQGVMNSKEDADIIKATTWMMSQPNDEKENRLCKVPTSTSVKVLEVLEEEGWTKIEYWGEEGYVPSKSVIKGWGTIRE